MRPVKTHKQILLAFLLIAALGLLIWHTVKYRTVTVDSGYRMTMGTVARIVATAQYKKEADTSVNDAFEAIYRIDKLMSDYDPNSQLSLVNQDAFERPVPVDVELFEVLAAAKFYSCASDGAFDVTIGPVVQLWRKAKEDGVAPNPGALARVREAVGHENLILDNEKHTVRFAKKEMLLDLGGIAKGYAIDKAIEILQTAGLKGAMVDIGGDLRCFGDPDKNAQHWLIGLQDPHNEEDILLTLIMDDMAVATSGDYRRFVMIGDEKHSHIINPVTVDSAKDLSSVTIIAPTAMQADALATAVTVLGDEKGLELIETIPECEAFVIQSEGSVFQQSSNADMFMEK